VFVGPNNAGKSAALREIEEYIGNPINPKVIISANIAKTGSTEQLWDLLEKKSKKIWIGAINNFQYQGLRINVSGQKQHIEHFWKNDLTQIRGLFCFSLSTETRITDSNPAGAISTLEDPASHPIHLVFVDDIMELRLSGYFRRAFNTDLILFRLGGSKWPFLVGDRFAPEQGETPISASYNERLLATTVPLQAQGDGMRSFTSVILHILAPDAPSVLILDEPEAFLHPPQARLLGEFIARERSSHSQLFIATHSPDVLQGLLGAAPERLRVIRIQREGSVNRVKELDKEQAKEIASDPLMKFSGVMSGIFHHRVIICESDADCTFYSSILDLPKIRGDHQPDVLFVHAGGKHRMAAMVEALRALDVSVDVIADIDILREDPIFERLVRALGGDWDEVAADVRPLKTDIEKHKPWLNAGEVSKGIRNVIDGAPTAGEFPRGLRSEIESIFRKASPWDAIKDAGKAAVPAGQATQHYNSLQNNCKARGLWIVPVGELEGFCRSVGGHGPRWVQQVLLRGLADDPELEEARNFVGEIWRRVGQF
jgi:hypothetical protein